MFGNPVASSTLGGAIVGWRTTLPRSLPRGAKRLAEDRHQHSGKSIAAARADLQPAIAAGVAAMSLHFDKAKPAKVS